MIMKIDMVRYFIMYKHGGIYTDMDYLMFKEFDMLDNKVVIPCNRENDVGEPICLGNCIFASEAQHPFWKTLMDTLFTIDRSSIDYNNDKNIDSNILGTGPLFVYDMWKKYEKKNEIYIPKRSFFHPPTNHDQKYITVLQKNGCYGMHVCTGLWRNNQL